MGYSSRRRHFFQAHWVVLNSVFSWNQFSLEYLQFFSPWERSSPTAGQIDPGVCPLPEQVSSSGITTALCKTSFIPE
jgi:hypothetical protein